MANDIDKEPDGADRLLRVALVLLQRAVVIGLVLFALPPTGELPYRWQVAVAFPMVASWCYVHGVFARRNVQVAALEAIPTLWLSLKCTDVTIRLVGLWS